MINNLESVINGGFSRGACSLSIESKIFSKNSHGHTVPLPHSSQPGVKLLSVQNLMPDVLITAVQNLTLVLVDLEHGPGLNLQQFKV